MSAEDRQGPRPEGRRSSRGGFTVVELLCAIVVLTLGVWGFSQALVSSISAGRQTRESARATQAARATLESMHAVALDEAFARFNATLADDPAGGLSPGAGFAVPGLDAIDGDPDGLPGEILFPVDPAAPAVLREDLVDRKLGTPLDLNGDDGTDAADHAGDYRLLPVLVRVTWRGPRGASRVELRTILGGF